MHLVNLFKASYFVLTLALAALSGQPALAIDYGIYDARALAMGGTVMAVGTTSQGQYYNPALLAFHSGDEDKTRDGRTYFPTFVAQVSNTAESALNAVNDSLDTKLTNAVDAFNRLQGAATAGEVAASASDLRDVLKDIANQNLSFDAFFGMSLSEPSDREGGAFYMGARVVGIGTSNISQADLALLDQYILATSEIAGGATSLTIATRYPDLVNPDGSLRDPALTLTSSAQVGGVGIAEWGLALAKEFTFWERAVSLGVTPKMMRVDIYRDDASFNNNGTINGLSGFSENRSSHLMLNIDAGVAAIISEHYRLSLGMKDLVAQTFVTKQTPDPITGLAGPDLIVKLSPRSRAGIGYVTENFSIGLDYDLKQSRPMANEATSQELSLGAEYELFNALALRIGYRQDQTGLRADIISGGIGLHWRRFVADFAYSQSSDMKGAGLQLGWAF